MFVGHYSASFLAKTIAPKIPLWILFLAVQLVDIFWALFILTGVEKVRLVPELPSNPLDLYFMPYTHSLLATGFWSAVAFVLVYFTPKIRLSLKASFIIACAVFSHWVLDFLVHRPDLLVVSEMKVGLGLWNFPILAFLLEVFLLAVAILLYIRISCPQEHKRKVLLFGIVMIGIQFSTSFGPVPPFIPMISSAVLISFFIFAGVAKYIEKSNSQLQP